MCVRGRGGKQIVVEGQEGEVSSYLCRVLTMTSGSADFGESYIDCERKKERKFMHITALIQGYACTENYGREKKREREGAEERERNKESELSLRLNFILDAANNSASF